LWTRTIQRLNSLRHGASFTFAPHSWVRVTIGTRQAACTMLPTLRCLDGGLDVELSTQNQIRTVATISEVLARYTNCDNRMDAYSNGRLQAKGK
jgi:hypothetical protein